MKDDRQGRIPYEHALALYQQQDPEDIEMRIHIPYDPNTGLFSFRFLGADATLSWPEARLEWSDRGIVTSYVIGILVLRYFALGSFVPLTGRLITYKEIPDGLVYYPNFSSRTIQGLAKAFEVDPGLFDFRAPGLEPVGLGDRAVVIEWINGVPVTYVGWEGDEEFSASANILFDESIKYFFNAEDLAVLPDLGITWLIKKGRLPLDWGMYPSVETMD